MLGAQKQDARPLALLVTLPNETYFGGGWDGDHPPETAQRDGRRFYSNDGTWSLRSRRWKRAKSRRFPALTLLLATVRLTDSTRPAAGRLDENADTARKPGTRGALRNVPRLSGW